MVTKVTMVAMVPKVSMVARVANLNDIGLEKRCEKNGSGLPFQSGMPYHASKWRQW